MQWGGMGTAIYLSENTKSQLKFEREMCFIVETTFYKTLENASDYIGNKLFDLLCIVSRQITDIKDTPLPIPTTN